MCLENHDPRNRDRDQRVKDEYSLARERLAAASADRHCRSTKGVRNRTKDSPPSWCSSIDEDRRPPRREEPPPLAAGTVTCTPALSSARTRPASSRACTGRERPSTRVRHGTKPHGPEMLGSRSFSSPHSSPLHPSAGRNRASMVFSRSSPLADSLAYLSELPLRLLLLRGVDRRPQQLRELTRVHRSGPPQLACIN